MPRSLMTIAILAAVGLVVYAVAFRGGDDDAAAQAATAPSASTGSDYDWEDDLISSTIDYVFNLA